MDKTFKADLEDGKWAETLFSKTAQNTLGATDIEFNNSKDVAVLREWDIRLTTKNGDVRTFEVKWDKRSTDTGNFAIEFFGRSSASGIEATKADYWVILSDNKFYIFSTAELKKLIRNNPFRSLCIGNGTAYVYLIPIAKAKEIARIIDLNN